MLAIFPELINAAKEKQIEKLAVLSRTYFVEQRPHHPRIEVEQMLANAGIVLQSSNGADDALVCAKDEGGSPRIVAFINQAINQHHERNFLLAHILGHALLHIMPKLAEAEWKTSGLRETVSPMKRYLGKASAKQASLQHLEREADLFAAALLMPKAMLEKAHAAIHDIDKLAEFFAVERIMVVQRLSDLGLLEASPANFLQAEQRSRGMNEPAASGDATPADRLHSDRTDKGLYPPSYAAANYSATEQRTGGVGRVSGTSKEAKHVDAAAAAKKDSGAQAANTSLARIRALAKKIDGSVS